MQATLKPPRPLIANDFTPVRRFFEPPLVVILDLGRPGGNGLGAPRSAPWPGEPIG